MADEPIRQRLRKAAHQRRARRRRVRTAGLAKAAVRMDLAARVPADVPAAVPAARAKADGSSSAARRFASSASRRSTASTTRTCGCCRSLWPRAGKIVPRRLTGVCTPHQRRLADAIKQARNIALLPFAVEIACQLSAVRLSVRERKRAAEAGAPKRRRFFRLKADEPDG